MYRLRLPQRSRCGSRAVAEITVGGKVAQLPLPSLLLDPANPRLPESFRDAGASQEEIALYIDKHHDPLRVAQSIAQHGYFASEPIIVTPDNDDRYVVVEGNRRLVALLGLSSKPLRARLASQTRGWARLSWIEPDVRIPAVEVNDRSKVDALLGFRHISGIEPWDPFAQARFISELVAQYGDLRQVAEIVGRSISEVRSLYRDHDIVMQAKQEFGIDTKKAESQFGVFNAAMGIVALRDYVGAPAPGGVDPNYYPIPPENETKLRHLIEYIYGDERGRGRVITDSRQLRSLATVLADESGEAERELRKSRDLAKALEASSSRGDRAKLALARALRSLEDAKSLVGDGAVVTEEMQSLLTRIGAILDEIGPLASGSGGDE